VTGRPDIIPEGLPDHLPEGERLVWQGRPDWKHLAINVFHVRKVAIYFALIIAVQAAWHLAEGAPLHEALKSAPALLGMGAAACVILSVLAFASARTTHYTLTSKRVLMKVGMALPMIVNVPFSQVNGVSFAVTGGNRGNIVFKTGGPIRLAYLVLWPHARPWHLAKPQPAFRDIPDVEAVASRLARVIGGEMPAESVSASASSGHLIAAE
jgi:hypothetical protein